MISPQNIGDLGHQAKRQAQPWVEGLARAGYAARGVVYIVIGILAFQSAFSTGGQTTSSQGALHTIAGQPFGRILLGLVAIGLLGYALWRLVEAGSDPENKGSDAKGILQRLGSALSGLAYTGLAFTAFKILLGTRSGKSASQQDWTARLLSQPLGQWLVGLVGLIVIGLGFNALYKAFTAKFRDKLKTEKMSALEDTWITRIGRAGYGSRGVVWVMVGWFLVQAGRYSDASKTRSLPQTLDTLAAQPYGPWLLGGVAVGLVAYGLYALAEARYRKIYL
jgi:multisubunit Na+/H+ antiporter MnhC subunit